MYMYSLICSDALAEKFKRQKVLGNGIFYAKQRVKAASRITLKLHVIHDCIYRLELDLTQKYESCYEQDTIIILLLM